MTKLMSIYEDASEGDKCDRCGTIDDDLPTNRVRIPTSKR